MVLLSHPERGGDGEGAPESDASEGLKGSEHLHGVVSHDETLHSALRYHRRTSASVTSVEEADLTKDLSRTKPHQHLQQQRQLPRPSSQHSVMCEISVMLLRVGSLGTARDLAKLFFLKRSSLAQTHLAMNAEKQLQHPGDIRDNKPATVQPLESVGTQSFQYP